MQLNVLYILTKLELGGAQKVCLSLHNGLIKDGHKAFLVSGTEGVLITEAKKHPGCIFLKSLKREVSWAVFFQDWIVFWDLFFILRAYKKKYPYLIVHTHSTKAGILGRWAAFFARVPSVHTVHGFGFHAHQPWILWILIVTIEWVTTLITARIICVSKKDQLQGARVLPGFAKKSLIIRAGVDQSHFVKKPIYRANRDFFIIGTIACFKPQKNILDLLEVFKLLRQVCSNVTLEIIGDGVLRTEIESWICKNNLENEIILHGWQDNVRVFLERWDIFALSSLWEGLPCSIVEARLAGLPVVAYDVGGISEVIVHGENGYLVSSGDKEGLFVHLKNLLQDNNLLSQMRQDQQNLESFSNNIMISQHEELYRSILKYL